MAFCDVRFYGESIGMQTGMSVILPQGRGPLPVLYLLHGLSDDHTMWPRRSNIERYVADMGLIVVMPQGGRSFYVNDPRPGGFAFEDHIVKDVVGFVDRTFPTTASREGRAIAGLSMGGYGSLMLAMRYPDMFSVACSHSGAFFFAHNAIENRDDVNALAEAVGEGYDCHLLAGKLKKSGRKIAMRIDCGVDDFLIQPNRDLHAHLDAIGIEHVYEEYPGEHTWEYWNEHVRQTLEFIEAKLLSRSSAA